MTYPLSTLAPTISDAGISAVPYPDILESLKASFRSVYGDDAYIDPDSQDGQWLAILAQAIYDSGQAAVAVYNSFRPTGAVGAGLSSIVKINGIARNVATNSTADVTITGQAGTIISAGIVSDANGEKWDLPATVTIPISGEITVTASAQTIGAISASANTITGIATPTRGWQAVTNDDPATVGAPVETDAALRRRQSQAVAAPAQTPLEALYSGLWALDGITDLAIYENDTDTTDGMGIPSHSIWVVIEGGDSTEIAGAIARYKGPGTGTHGNTEVLYSDQNGVPSLIKFDRVALVPITVEVDITAFDGYTTAIGTAIVQAVADYISGDSIGEDVYFARIYTPANSQGETYVVTAIRIARDAGSPAAANVVIDPDERAECTIGDITLTVAP